MEKRKKQSCKGLITIPVKKQNKISIQIIGGNAEGVTGSASLISYGDNKKLLFEFGMIQRGKTIYENYCLNKTLICAIKPQKIDYIIAGHCHCDHIGLIPALYKKNCHARIIVPKGSLGILKEMWFDSAYINSRDAEVITSQNGKEYLPLYDDDDVIKALEHVEEYPFHELIELDDNVRFRYFYAGHILFSAQTELFIRQDVLTKKILFTSDLGNIRIKDTKPFVENFEPIEKANIVLGEATYAAASRTSPVKQLALDMDKIKTVITQYCIDNNRVVVIPCFALDRLPYMLWILYSLFSEDENFRIPVLIDSPLGARLLNVYRENLGSDMYDKFSTMLQWKNIRILNEPLESKAAIASSGSKVVLSSSGMLTAGRSVKWVQSVLPNPNDCILFIGYSATNTLAYKIKNSSDARSITINGKAVANKCQICDLHSFSSHMQHDDLLDYYSSINCEKIYLVHSDQDSKLDFKTELEEKIREKGHTTKVIATNKSTIINL